MEGFGVEHTTASVISHYPHCSRFHQDLLQTPKHQVVSSTCGKIWGQAGGWLYFSTYPLHAHFQRFKLQAASDVVSGLIVEGFGVYSAAFPTVSIYLR